MKCLSVLRYACLTILVFSSVVPAQEIKMPADFALDLQLGTTLRGRMMGGATEIADPDVKGPAEDVFHRLVAAGFTQPYPWRLTLVNSTVINAASNAGGQVYLYGGLLQRVSNSPGLTAAVLSHEVAHTGLRHQVRVYLQMVANAQMEQYYQYRAAHGDKNANWALVGFRIAAPIALKKVEREQEHEADSTGMLIMARAGYHPDYVFALHHLLLADMGEQSKFAAFFSNHPRWETRDQRSERSYADALAEFSARWPDARKSPGGDAPVVAFVGKPVAIENKSTKTADIQVPISCRNSKGPITVAIGFVKDNKPVASTDATYTTQNGSLGYVSPAECRDEEAMFRASIPATAVGKDDRKLKAIVAILDDQKRLIDRSSEFEVHIPKP